MNRRRKISSRTRTLIAVVVVGGAYAISTGVSNASENCTGLDQSLRPTLDFMADQRTHPNVQTAAVIQNRQAIVDLINLQRKQAGCTSTVTASAPAAAETGTNSGGGIGSASANRKARHKKTAEIGSRGRVSQQFRGMRPRSQTPSAPADSGISKFPAAPSKIAT